MKKLVILALVAILLPSIAQAQAYPIKQGDPAIYFDFLDAGTVVEVVEGESYCDGNYFTSWGSATCPDPIDTFACVQYDLLGWTITHSQEGVCHILDGNGVWYWYAEYCITVPCDGSAIPGQLNTWSVQMAYCDVNMVAQPDSGDCEDPNYRSSGTIPIYSTITQDFEVVEPAPALVIFQDTLYLIEEGLAAAYVPFSICNGDLCAGTGDYDYVITSKGHVGAAINQTGTATAVEPGNCEDIFAVIDAGAAVACTYDTLTILGWDVATGLVYDTCVLPIHVVEPVPVPLFTAPVVTILVLAMILAAAVIMKRHAVSKV